MVNSVVERELKEDAADFYHKQVKFFFLPFFVAYSLFALFGSTSVAPPSGTKHNSSGRVLTHISRDSGLRMQLHEMLPFVLHRGHSVSAVLLCFTMFYQKETVVQMHRANGEDYFSYLFWHRWVGRLALLLVTIMDLCGLLMGPLSSWQNSPRLTSSSSHRGSSCSEASTAALQAKESTSATTGSLVTCCSKAALPRH